jgi:hypothetical protein
MLFCSNYLARLKINLHIDSRRECELIRELEDHFEDSSDELKNSGLSEEEAANKAMQRLGSPQLIAKQIYEVYSQGSWRQALSCSLPHFLIALLFAMHWWQNTLWIAVTVLVAISSVIYGWSHGKPTWLFTWLGYLLIPVIYAGTLLLWLPSNLIWFAALVYFPATIYILVKIGKQVIKVDWLFLSLALFPLPIVLCWLAALSSEDMIIKYEQIHEAAPSIATSFAILALAAVTFIRVKPRWIKTSSLLLPEITVLLIVGLNTNINFGRWLLLFLLALLILLFGPAFLEHKIRDRLT